VLNMSFIWKFDVTLPKMLFAATDLTVNDWKTHLPVHGFILFFNGLALFVGVASNDISDRVLVRPQTLHAFV